MAPQIFVKFSRDELKQNLLTVPGLFQPCRQTSVAMRLKVLRQQLWIQCSPYKHLSLFV
jgi:hypothetical protein